MRPRGNEPAGDPSPTTTGSTFTLGFAPRRWPIAWTLLTLILAYGAAPPSPAAAGGECTLLRALLASAALEVGEELRRAGEPEGAEDALLSAARLARAGGLDRLATIARVRAARLSLTAGRWEELAERMGELPVALDDLPPRDACLALDLLAASAAREQRWREVRELRFAAAERARELDSPGPHAYLAARAAEALRRLGEGGRALEEAEAAWASLEETDEPVRSYYRGRVALVTARANRDCGTLERARSLAEEVLALETTSGQVVEAEQILCDLDLYAGRHRELAARIARLEELHARGVALGLAGNTALARARLAVLRGEHALALELFDALIEETADPDRRGEILLARAYARVHDDLSGALSDARASAENGELRDDPDLEHRARLALGRCLRVAERLGAAACELERALELGRDTGRHVSMALTRAELAQVEVERGSLERAATLIEPALETLRREGARDAASFAGITTAELALAQGDLARVRRELARAETTFEEGVGAGLVGLELARLRSRVWDWAHLHQDLTVAESARAQGPADARDALSRGFAAAGRWKARALFEGLAGTDPIGVELGAEEVVARLHRHLGGRLLVEYACGRERLYAYVLDARGLTHCDLGRWGEIQRRVAAYQVGISDATAIYDARRIAREGSELYRSLLAPLLQGRRPGAVVIVPTLGLERLPFEALVTAVEGGLDEVHDFGQLRFLLDETEVSYAPSSPVLALLAQRPPPSGPSRALLVGDPLLPAEERESSPPDPRGLEELGPLPGTRRELLDLARGMIEVEDVEGMRRHRAVERGRGRDAALEERAFDLYLGARASRDLFAADLSRYGLLHLATHGLVDESDPHGTALVLSPDAEGQRLLDLNAVRALELDAQLVVLSACETGRGESLRGEGVQSLAAAFLEAGARRVIASLWLVDDGPTRELMEEFYLAERGGSVAPAAALRAARLALRQREGQRGVRPRRRGEVVVLSAAHPYTWASFIVVGSTP